LQSSSAIHFAGSSVFRRLDSNEISLSLLGLSETPRRAICCRTHYRVHNQARRDRPLRVERDAQQIALLSDEQMRRVKELTVTIDNLLSSVRPQ